MRSPLVSVILPVYNTRPFLRPAVESLLHQTYSNLEILAIDDGSTDGSTEMLRDFADRDRRIRLLSRENRGLIATLNQGLELANGELVARMDGDDICYPDRIERQVEAFVSNPQLCLCGMGVDYLYFRNRVTSTKGLQLTSREIRVRNIFYPAVTHAVAMLNNAYIQKQKLRYDPKYPHAEDFDLFRRILREGSAIVLDKKGLIVRRHGHGNVSTRYAKQQVQSHLSIVAEQLEFFGISRRKHALFEILSRDAIIDRDVLCSISDLFLELKSFTNFDRDEHHAYEQGMEVFAWLLFSIVSAHVRPDKVLIALEHVGVLSNVPRRTRLSVRLAKLCGAKAGRHLSDRLADALEYRRAKPVHHLLPELSSWL